MKITPLQTYMILGLIGFVAVSFLFYQVALKPINREIASLESERDQKRKELDEAKKIVAKYVEFKKRADSIQRELEWIQNRIPKTVEKDKLVEAVSLLQNRSGVYLTSFLVQVPAAKDAYTEIPVTLKFNASFKGLLKFLKEVTLSNLTLTVHDMAVTAMVDPVHPDVTLTAQMILSGIQAK